MLKLQQQSLMEPIGAGVAPLGDRLWLHGSRTGQAQSGAVRFRQIAYTVRRPSTRYGGVGVHIRGTSRRLSDLCVSVRRGREHSVDRHDARRDVHHSTEAWI